MVQRQKLKWPSLADKREALVASLASIQEAALKHEPLLELAQVEYLTGDLYLAASYYRQVIDEGGNTNHQISAYLGLAWIAYTHSKWSDASDHLLTGFGLSPEPEQKARLLALRGLVNYRQGKYEKAVEDSEAILRLTPRNEAGGFAHNTLGIVLHATQRKSEALEHLRIAEDIARSIGHPELLARVLNCRGTIHFETKDYAEAEHEFKAAIEITQDVGLKVYMGYPLINLAGVYTIQNDYAQGLIFLNQSEAVFQDIGDVAMLSAINHEIGNAYRVQRDYYRALIHINTAINQARQCGNQRNLVFSYRELGLLHRDQHQWNDAIMDFKLAKELAIIINDKIIQIELDQYLKETYRLIEGIY